MPNMRRIFFFKKYLLYLLLEDVLMSYNGLRIKVVAQALIKCTELKSTQQAEQKLF